MACEIIQTSSSSQMICKYDVFVSFRGEDTRNNFTDFLFAALKRNGIEAFRDDQNLPRGEPISRELLQAIRGSRVFIVIFSKKYANSTWCLEELTEIVDRIPVHGQRVMPIFYDVDPSEVRHQGGDYAIAFSQHEERFNHDLEKIQRWRGALKQVASLAGWDVKNKSQYEEIEKIVKNITSILGPKFSSLPNDLVGMHSRVEDLEKLLDLGLNDDVKVVGICGMGGTGKTTLVTVLYERIFHQYDVNCFIDDVSKIYRDCGIIGAQKKLLCQTLKGENLEICNHIMATNLIRTTLQHRMALIVLDNIDNVEQLEKLVVHREWLSGGSRIIITSRDEHILREYGVDEVYNVQLLNKDEALNLFAKKAFKCEVIPREYKMLTYGALAYAQGLPLAIKVLGSFLFDRNVSHWASALARLRENPMGDIFNVLQISYDALEESEKQIFLDIACFFNKKSLEYVKRILNYCEFHPDIGLKVLSDKSLITISLEGYECIKMHGLLEELGRKIVQEKSSQNPGKWSRLWLYKDLDNVLSKDTATKNIEAIVVDEHPNSSRTSVQCEALSKMTQLRLLKLRGLNLSGSLVSLSNELRYLEWDYYPSTHLPSSFQPDKLVELILQNSNTIKLWKGIKHLPNLRVMDLSNSKNLVETPDFTGIPNLKKINLSGCKNLARISPSIGFLSKLAYLYLRNCKSLKSLPNNILCLCSLEYLCLEGCLNLFNIQLLEKAKHPEGLKELDISHTAMHGQPKSILRKKLPQPFRLLHSKRQKDSIYLSMPALSGFPCLLELDLSFCNLRQIPDAIGWLHSLEGLFLSGNNFDRLPSTMKMLSRLVRLELNHCKQLKYLPDLPLPSSSTIFPLKSSARFLMNLAMVALDIFNCPKLVDVKGCISIAISWLIRVMKIFEKSVLYCESLFKIVIPGSQIPTWFNNQSVGCSLSVEVGDNNWIGIVACVAILSCHDPHASGYSHPYISYCYDIDKEKVRIIKPELVMVESQDLFIFYSSWPAHCSRSSMTELETTKIDITFGCVSGAHLRLRTIKCGLRIVYKEDLEELSRIMISSGSNMIQIHDDLGIGTQLLLPHSG